MDDNSQVEEEWPITHFSEGLVEFGVFILADISRAEQSRRDAAKTNENGSTKVLSCSRFERHRKWLC